MTAIVLDDLSFRYPASAVDAIARLSLSIDSGEAHALLGASGAGKTTLLNLVSGLLQPTGGRVLFDGADVSRRPPKLRHIAQVFQFPVLYDALTVAENLAFPLSNFGVPKDAIAERVDYIASELALGGILGRNATGLSLFEKQLVSVGKALMREDTGVVLLDEPLTAVEPKRKWELRQTLKKVQADLGVTMIYVTHDQTEALTFADRVSVLTGDGILQTGSPEEIYSRPSHEFVGTFVGSPGMDFISADALEEPLTGMAGTSRLGVRAEWLELCDPGSGHISGVSGAMTLAGTARGSPTGVLLVDTPSGPVHVNSTGLTEAGTRVGIRLRRCVAFADGRAVASLEL